MLKIDPTAFGLLRTLNLMAFLLVVGFHSICGDVLLFRSDAYSLAVYLSSVTLVLCCALGLTAFVLQKLTKVSYEKLLGLCSLLNGWAFLSAFLGSGLLFFVVTLSFKLNVHGPMRWLQDGFRIALVGVGILSLSGAFTYFLPDRKQLQKRIQLLAIFLFPLVLIFGPVAVAWNHLSMPNVGGENSRHLVLVVLDGLKANDLNTFNPEAKRNEFDQLLERGDVANSFYTSAVWTNGYFTTLYQGDPRGIFDMLGERPKTERTGRKDGKNLFKTLQDNDVGTRWIVFHGNGIPDANASHITNYKGLRSSLLSHNHANLPRSLGLSYHLILNTSMIYGDPKKTMLEGTLGPLVYQAINPVQGGDNVFTDVLLPELESITQRNSKSFTIFHIPAGFYRIRSDNIVFENDVKSRLDESSGDVLPADMVARGFEDFLEKLRASKHLHNATVVLTADHGLSDRPGRTGKIHWPFEEVARVPFVVFNTQSPVSLSGRTFSTPDLTHSLIDFFGIENNLNPNTVSIFEKEATGYISYATMPTEISWEGRDLKTWYLVLVKGQEKIQMNVHSKGAGETTYFKIAGLRETRIRTATGPPQELGEEIQQALLNHGFPVDSIHASFGPSAN